MSAFGGKADIPATWGFIFFAGFALRALKKKMRREGLFREMKLRRHFEKPSQRRKRERAEAVRRHRKLLRKRMEREGF